MSKKYIQRKGTTSKSIYDDDIEGLGQTVTTKVSRSDMLHAIDTRTSQIASHSFASTRATAAKQWRRRW